MLKKLLVLLMITCSIAKIEASQSLAPRCPGTPPNQIATAPTNPPNQKELYAQAKRAGMAAAAIERQRNPGRVRSLDFTNQPSSGPRVPASVPAWTLR